MRTPTIGILACALSLSCGGAADPVAPGLPGDNPIADRADLVVRLPLDEAASGLKQPMGSLFEQVLHLYLDLVVLRLMADLGKTQEDMERVHSNLP